MTRNCSVRNRTELIALGLAGSLALLACGPAAHTRAAGALGAVSVTRVAWNPTHVPVGNVRAVADAGPVVAVFSDRGATVLSSGAVVATDRSVTSWAGAATIPGADGSPRWIVSIDASGGLRYLRGLSSFEDVSARYGLAGLHVRQASALGSGKVAFLLDRELAIADGRHVARYASPLFTALVGGGGYAAGVVPDAGLIFGAVQSGAMNYAIAGLTHAAIGPEGRIYASTRRALYTASPGGDLVLIYDATADTLHGLVASGDRVWFADGNELGAIDGDGRRVSETRGARISPNAALAPSPSGDVWVLSKGSLDRFARNEPQRGTALAWKDNLESIFARVCSSCHGPGGASGIDLSTPEAWRTERAAIQDRVIVTRTMPPQGHVLSDRDREAIRRWSQGQ